MLDSSWMPKARCIGADEAIMFPQTKDDADRGKRLCRACPVRALCRQYALDMLKAGNEISGLWGGEHVAELRRIPTSGVVYTDRLCEAENCDNRIPEQKYCKGGNMQKFCSPYCRQKTGKARAYQRLVAAQDMRALA
jgi:hypothetical protein